MRTITTIRIIAGANPYAYAAHHVGEVVDVVFVDGWGGAAYVIGNDLERIYNDDDYEVLANREAI